MPLTCGVLIIGSLLWDSQRRRAAWRAARLDMASAEAVTAPIRYGRLSRSRGNSYTMVFSRLCPMGQAKLVPCSQLVSSSQNLIGEAEHLWKAEQPSAQLHRIAMDWGCVALLCNPNRKIPAGILKGWAERVNREPDYGNLSQTQEEGRLLTGDGLLRINWPTRVEDGSIVEMDLVLATANDPTLTGTPPSYPGAETIANAWNATAREHSEYFWKNTDHGIATFQDDEIRARLRPRQQGPP